MTSRIHYNLLIPHTIRNPAGSLEKHSIKLSFDTLEAAVGAIDQNTSSNDTYYLTAVGGKYGLGKIIRKRTPNNTDVAKQLPLKLGNSRKPKRKRVYNILGKKPKVQAVLAYALSALLFAAPAPSHALQDISDYSSVTCRSLVQSLEARPKEYRVASYATPSSTWIKRITLYDIMHGSGIQHPNADVNLVVVEVLNPTRAGNSKYIFQGVPKFLYQQWVISPSVGSFYHTHIKGRYNCNCQR